MGRRARAVTADVALYVAHGAEKLSSCCEAEEEGYRMECCGCIPLSVACASFLAAECVGGRNNRCTWRLGCGCGVRVWPLFVQLEVEKVWRIWRFARELFPRFFAGTRAGLVFRFF